MRRGGARPGCSLREGDGASVSVVSRGMRAGRVDARLRGAKEALRSAELRPTRFMVYMLGRQREEREFEVIVRAEAGRGPTVRAGGFTCAF
jgi:hypothetical protein